MTGRLRTLASETMIYGGFTIVGRFITFLLTPIYTNYLTMQEVGDINWIFVCIAFLNIVYCFGMEGAFFRFYKKDELEHNKIVFTHAYLLILAISLIVSTLAFIFAEQIAPVMTDLEYGVTLIRISALIPLLDSMMTIPYALLRISNKPKRFALTRFIVLLVAVSLNLLFIVVLGWNAEGVFLSTLLANIVGVASFIPDILKYMKFKFNSSMLKEMLAFGVPTIPASLSAMILQMADRPILKYMTDSSTLGLYQVNHKLGIPMMLMVAVFDYAYKPFYLSHFDDEDARPLFARIMTYFTLVCAGIFLLTGFYMDFLIRMPFIGGNFINSDYWSGLGILPIVLGGYFFNGIYNNLAAGFYITKTTKYLPIAIVIAAIINIVLNIVLIPYMSYWASAMAMLISYIVAAVILYFYAQKVYPIAFEWKRLGMLFAITLGVYFAGYHISNEFSMVWSFIIRTGFFLLLILLLKLFGFFTSSEIARMKRFINFR
jgi:O-antigen/teichoic acid export membrane protein